MSLVAVAAVLVVLAATAGAAYLGAAVLARHRAQSAADLAAVAAASTVAAGADAACAQAMRIAAEMRAVVNACAVDGLDIVLTAEAAVTLGRWGVRPATAHARAGPADVRR